MPNMLQKSTDSLCRNFGGSGTEPLLENIAAQLAAHEGWAWSMGRTGAIITWGDDREHYSMLEKPIGVLTELEQEAQTQRGLRHDELIEEGDAAADPAEAEACYKAARRIEDE